MTVADSGRRECEAKGREAREEGRRGGGCSGGGDSGGLVEQTISRRRRTTGVKSCWGAERITRGRRPSSNHLFSLVDGGEGGGERLAASPTPAPVVVLESDHTIPVVRYPSGEQQEIRKRDGM